MKLLIALWIVFAIYFVPLCCWVRFMSRVGNHLLALSRAELDSPTFRVDRSGFDRAHAVVDDFLRDWRPAPAHFLPTHWLRTFKKWRHA